MKRGLSLIETMIYIAILLAVLLLFVKLVTSISQSYLTIGVTRRLDAVAGISMDRMTREIRSASDVDVDSIFGVSPGRLVLKKVNSLGVITRVGFIAPDSHLRIIEDGVDSGPLFPLSVTTSSLIFRQIDSGVSKGIKIEMALRSDGGGVTRTQNYYSTIILRGTYLND